MNDKTEQLKLQIDDKTSHYFACLVIFNKLTREQALEQMFELVQGNKHFGKNEWNESKLILNKAINSMERMQRITRQFQERKFLKFK